MRWLLHLALLCPVLLAGCGGDIPPEKLSQAESAVQATLQAWQKGESLEKMTGTVGAVQFSEDWTRQFRLSSFQIQKVEYDPREQIIRCFTTLELLDRRGRTSSREAAYQVKLGSPIVVARDPYF